MKTVLPALLILALLAHNTDLCAATEKKSDEELYKTELLIQKSQDQAIFQLSQLLKSDAQPEQKPRLLHQLAELYMKKAKSNRFLENMGKKSDSPSMWMSKAIEVYVDIAKKYPKYDQMDIVLFNHAYALKGLGFNDKAQALFLQLLTLYPKTHLASDALVSIGEMYFERSQFAEALAAFKRVDTNSKNKIYATYKMAWTYYNLKQTQNAMLTLEAVIDQSEGTEGHNLRTEALKDLGIFFSDSRRAEDLYGYFSKLSTGDELTDLILQIAKMYDSHSRQKELVIFLDDFLVHEPLGQGRVFAYLINTWEVVKDRPHVLSTLERAYSIVGAQKEINDVALTLIKRWNDLLKLNKGLNKGQSEIRNWMTQVFKIYLENNPSDQSTRLALAEHYFEAEEFGEASAQYEIIANESTDLVASENASFACLVANKKASQKVNQSNQGQLDPDHNIELIQRHIARFPNGKHNQELSLNLAVQFFEKSDFVNSKKWLAGLVDSSNVPNTVAKVGGNAATNTAVNTNMEANIGIGAQDLLLEILNTEKNLQDIQKYSSEFIKKTKDTKRIEALNKIHQQAEFNSISLQGLEKKNLQQVYLDFFKKHSATDEGKMALWNSAVLAWELSDYNQSEKLFAKYALIFPQDVKKMDAYEMALTAAMARKDLNSSLAYSNELVLNDKNANLLFDLLTQARENVQRNIQGNIQGSVQGWETLEQKFSTFHREPWISQLAVWEIEKKFAQNKVKDAFDQAKKIMKNSKDPEVKAQARVIQARVLEKEFLNQSVKTHLSKLVTVLALKTEKLDKATTAYVSASNLTQKAEVQLQVLEGLQRCYSHFVEALNNLVLSESISDKEMKELRSEISALVAPIAEKEKETREKLKDLQNRDQDRKAQDRKALDRKPTDSGGKS